MFFLVRIKKSTLKNVEDLKFIPVNLHLEQFLVETNKNPFFQESEKLKAACYEFTSVGAFTTVHTSKPDSAKPLDYLMYNEKEFDFSPVKSSFDSDILVTKLIDNQILLCFYSLKLFIQLGNQLIDLKEHTVHRQSLRIENEIEIVKSRLEVLGSVIIKSLQFYANQNAQLARVEQKQIYLSLKEKLNFFMVKFQAFIIELDNIVQNNRYYALNDLLSKIITSIIEFYVRNYILNFRNIIFF